MNYNMGKRSKTPSLRYGKDRSGCMWGLISLLHFRNGQFARKMLPDSMHGTKQFIGVGYLENKSGNSSNYDDDCQDIHDNNKSMTETSNASKPCVKKLIDKEMINEHDSEWDNGHGEIGPAQSDNRYTKNIWRRKNKSSRKSGDLGTKDVDSAGHSCRQKTEKKYPNDLDIDALMEEFCSHIHQRSINCDMQENNELQMQSVEKNSGFEEKLCKAIELFISQKYYSAENLSANGKLHSEQIMDALQVLGSDKELFLKLQNNPNSLLLKYIQISEDTKTQKEKSKSFTGPRSELDISTSKQTEEHLNRKQLKVFRRRVKSQENISFNENEKCHATNRIVILKPGPSFSQNQETSFGSSLKSSFNIGNKGANEKVASHFSLSEIKRRLKNAMGKEQHGKSGKFIIRKSPTDRTVVGENVDIRSPSKDHFFIERHVKPSVGIQMGDKMRNPIGCEISNELETTGYSKQKVSNIYAEAKKHLSEMLSNRDEDQGCSNRLTTRRTLGKTLSVPDFNSPVGSPGRDWDYGFVTAQMKLSASNRVSRADNMLQLREIDISHQNSLPQNIETHAHCSDDNPIDKVEALNSDPRISEEAIYSDPNISDDSLQDYIKDETLHSSSDIGSNGNVEKVTDTAFQVDIEVLDASPGRSSYSISRNEQDNHTPNSDQYGYCEHLKMDSTEENQSQCSPVSSPPRSSIRKNVEDLVDDFELERPSPISVLENVFTKDEIGTARTIRQPAELKLPTLQPQFEEPDSSGTNHDVQGKTCIGDKEMLFGYINALMESSGLSSDDLYIRSLSSYQILDASLLDEVQCPSNQLCHENKVLFDCINEILLEVCGHYFGCLPWVSFVKPSIRLHPNVTNVLSEVWEGVYWHLLPQPLPNTLDQIVSKDMEKNGTWMYLRFDTESIGTDLEEEILEELFEELVEDTMSSFVDQIIENGSPWFPEESRIIL